ncbi:MAG: flagellar type III secretion system protein FliR [Firmicutes bacterium]|nr:flagellar type III secretion system protein FliR [Bacillota bacterium]
MGPWLAPEELLLFLFILARTAALLTALPIFGGPGVPLHARIGLAALTAVLLYTAVDPVPVPGDLGELAVVLVRETAVGLVMGFAVSLAFWALQVAGHLMDVPIGFGMVNVLDPQLGMQVPIMGQFFHVLATLIFFVINGHHTVLRSLAASYRLIPIGSAVWHGSVAETAVSVVGGMFAFAFRFALPVIAAAFLADVALGILSRAVPQINVFITGFPIKVVLGIAAALLALPVYVGVLAAVFGDNGDMMRWLWSFLAAL